MKDGRLFVAICSICDLTRKLRLIFCMLILTLEVLGGMNSVVLTDVVQCIATCLCWRLVNLSETPLLLRISVMF